MIKENYESFCINKLEKNKEMKCVMENNIILKGTNIFQLDNIEKESILLSENRKEFLSTNEQQGVFQTFLKTDSDKILGDINNKIIDEQKIGNMENINLFQNDNVFTNYLEK